MLARDSCAHAHGCAMYLQVSECVGPTWRGTAGM